MIKRLDELGNEVRGDSLIISASRRTDIPAFYGKWFINRIKDGYFYRVNPFNANQVKGFSLMPEDVDAIVFWTKNPAPFIKHLNTLDEMGYNYYFQYTLNNYPAIFEPYVPPIKDRLDSFKYLGERLGSGRVIWRYDPIIISTAADEDYHLGNIEYIAGNLKGYTERLIISFLDFYEKLKGRLKMLEIKYDMKIIDITEDGCRERLFKLAESIKSIADKYGLEVYTCGEVVDLGEWGIEHGSCIDGGLIKRLFNINRDFAKDRSQRSQCLCAASVDVGVYNTCKFKCSYCYANYNIGMIERNIEKHIITSPSMIGEYPACGIEIMKDKISVGKKGEQLSLFDSI